MSPWTWTVPKQINVNIIRENHQRGNEEGVVSNSELECGSGTGTMRQGRLWQRSTHSGSRRMAEGQLIVPERRERERCGTMMEKERKTEREGKFKEQRFHHANNRLQAFAPSFSRFWCFAAFMQRWWAGMRWFWRRESHEETEKKPSALWKASDPEACGRVALMTPVFTRHGGCWRRGGNGEEGRAWGWRLQEGHLARLCKWAPPRKKITKIWKRKEIQRNHWQTEKLYSQRAFHPANPNKTKWFQLRLVPGGGPRRWCWWTAWWHILTWARGTSCGGFNYCYSGGGGEGGRGEEGKRTVMCY